jgi:tRNA G18 (ribose-2'-O)-methylase SpoU
VNASRFELMSVLVTPAALRALSDVLSDAQPWPIYVCNASLLQTVTGFNFHRGCLALVRRPARAATLGELAKAPYLLALEGVGNPDNVGGLFRVAGALSVGGIVLDRACADPLYRKAIRTSMGAALHVPFVVARDFLTALQELRTAGCRLVALTPDPAAAPIHELTTSADERVVLLLGSEGHGLPPATLPFADTRVRIPMNPGADSLNVVVAGAVALYEVQRAAGQWNFNQGSSSSNPA